MSDYPPPPQPEPQGAVPAAPTNPPGAYEPAVYQPGVSQPGGYQPPAYPTPQVFQQYPGAAPAYAPAPYGAYAAPRKTNVLSIIALIASIAGLFWLLPFVGSLAGAIMGHISLNQVKTSGEQGRGMALAAVIIGWVGVGIVALLAIFFVLLIGVGAESGSYT